MDDRRWMERALALAQEAANAGEVPVGAVLVAADGELLSEGRNRMEERGDPTAHAELEAVRAATGAQTPGRWRLPPATLYVSLEPCLMCMGALVQARLQRLVFAAEDLKRGAAVSLYRVGEDHRLNHQIELQSGLLSEEAGELLRAFFRELRKREQA